VGFYQLLLGEITEAVDRGPVHTETLDHDVGDGLIVEIEWCHSMCPPSFYRTMVWFPLEEEGRGGVDTE
jgi:hypothetical protein